MMMMNRGNFHLYWTVANNIGPFLFYIRRPQQCINADIRRCYDDIVCVLVTLVNWLHAGVDVTLNDLHAAEYHFNEV